MATNHYGFNLPASGSAGWGEALNANAEAIDGLLASASAACAAIDVVSFLQSSSGSFDIAQNQEVVVTHAALSGSGSFVSVMERSASAAGLANVEIDFDLADRSRYLEQNAASGTEFASGKTQLKILSTNLYASAIDGGRWLDDRFTASLPSSSSWINASAYTLEFVLCPPSNFTGTLFVFGVGTTSITDLVAASVVGGTQKVNVAVHKGSVLAGSTTTATDLPVNAETHVAFVHSGGVGTIYLNGAFSASASIAQPNAVNRTFCRIHASFQSAQGSSYYGANDRMRNFRVWSAAKTPAEIASLAFADVAGNSANLVAYYKMNEGTGTSLTNSVTGSSIGAATTSAIYPVWETLSLYTTGSYWVATGDPTQFKLGTVAKINSVTMATTAPTNTSIKCAVSFDGRQTWKAYNGSSWLSVSGGLNGLSASGCTVAQAQTGLANYVPSGSGSLDFAWLLSSTSSLATPSLDQVTINYNEIAHYEIASLGRYGSSADYGVKRIDSLTTSLKKQSAGSARVFFNVIGGLA